MSPAGRPPIEGEGKNKDKREAFRLSESDIEKLSACCKALDMNKSAVIRLAIDTIYQGLDKK